MKRKTDAPMMQLMFVIGSCIITYGMLTVDSSILRRIQTTNPKDWALERWKNPIGEEISLISFCTRCGTVFRAWQEIVSDAAPNGGRDHDEDLLSAELPLGNKEA